MRWRGRRQSTNIEDRRGRRIPRAAGIGGGVGGLGLLVIIVAALLFGVDPMTLLQGGSVSLDPSPAPAGFPPGSAGSPLESQVDDERARFIAVVLADTEDVWNSLFAQAGARYQVPALVLFTQAVRSACGTASAASGPFYCPSDRKVYIDLSFYDALRSRFRAPGDFAQAYVVAHEIGHHVQTLTGVSQQVHDLRGRVSEPEYNNALVRLELQADCFAGVWANRAQRTKSILEPGDIEEALGAASAIGDDRIQKQTQGYVVPDSFTHGSSQQRVRWFRRGFESGDTDACDTFRAASL